MDDFRFYVRTAAADSKKSVAEYLHALLSPSAKTQLVDGKSVKFITAETFVSNISMEKSIRMRTSDIEEIFEICDNKGRGELSLQSLSDFAQKDVTNARMMALNLRREIINTYGNIKDHDREEEYARCFKQHLLRDKSNDKFADRDKFHEFAESMLDGEENEEDGVRFIISRVDNMIIHDLFDIDGDGSVSLEDFLAFILAQSVDAKRILGGKNPEAIVDVKISNSRDQDSELISQGYTHVSHISNGYKINPTGEALATGSFGRGQNIWIWRRKDGTCAGRLKPIISIQLEHTNASTSLVIAGFTCLTTPVSGQFVWIRRARNDDEELDALLDLRTTVGKMKDNNSPIHQSPGIGWSKVEDANFGRRIFGSQCDVFLWYFPARARVNGSFQSNIQALSSPIDEDRRAIITQLARMALRNYVPLSDMSKESRVTKIFNKDCVASPSAIRHSQSDMAAMYNKFSKLSYFTGAFNEARLADVLHEVGIGLDPQDVSVVYYHFDVSIDGHIDRDEFIEVLGLTDLELDMACERIRNRLTLGLDCKERTYLRNNRALSDVFAMINALGDGVLSYYDLATLMERLEIFVDEKELRRIMKLMKGTASDMIEEHDFINFVREPQFHLKQGHRLREYAAIMRSWVQRNASKNAGKDYGLLLDAVWKKFKYTHRKTTHMDFPGFISAEDVYYIMARNKCRLDFSECQLLTYLIAPEKEGKISRLDLQKFSNGVCRSYGEICNILERGLMEKVISAYREHREFFRQSGSQDPLLEGAFQNEVKKIVSSINKDSIDYPQSTAEKHSQNLVSAVQFKTGVENTHSGQKLTASSILNLEEWLSLGVFTGDTIAESGSAGIRISAFIHNICYACVGHLNSTKVGEIVSPDTIARDLQSMLRVEVERCSQCKKKLDYSSVFNLFDVNSSGAVDVDDFKKMLVKLRVVDGLADDAFPTLLKLFDVSNKGFILVEDLVAFCENGAIRDERLNEKMDCDDDDYGIASSTPPVVITRSVDADWLLWFLWKEAFKQDKGDPEGVIADLEAACTDNEIVAPEISVSTIPIEDLWNLLGEMGLRGIMVKDQFYLGCDEFTGRNQSREDVETRVDYSALCHNTIRMGRGYYGILQERKKREDKLYKQLKTMIFEELNCSDEMVNANSKSKTELIRFQKVMNRMDENGDGKLTVFEFKLVLKRMRLKCERNWTPRMIRKLFNEIGKSKDGLLNIEDFGVYVMSFGHNVNSLENEMTDVDEDDGVFVQKQFVTERDLYKKVGAVLQDVVPTAGSSSESHMDTVRAAVRRFFRRTDQKLTGLVPEDRFRSFCRKSGLHGVLTAGEVRRLIDTIRKKKRHDTYHVDYEKFCRLLGSDISSTSVSKAECVLARLQDAAIASSSAGRSFLAICSLFDGTKLSGTVTCEEMKHIFHIIGATDISLSDVENLKTLLPVKGIHKDGSIFYNEMNRLLQSPLLDFGYGKRESEPFHRTLNNEFPKLMSPIGFNGLESGKTINTPAGHHLSTPCRGPVDDHGDTDPNQIEKIIYSIAGRVNAAIRGKMKSNGDHYSLLRQFEDVDDTGYISFHCLLKILENFMITLTSIEMTALHQFFGRSEDDKIDYFRFCRMVEYASYTSEARQKRDINGGKPYLSSMVVERYIWLREENRCPKYLLSKYDLDDNGLVNVKKFKETLSRLDLLQNDYEMSRVLEDFANHADKSMIHYKEFFAAIEEEANKNHDPFSKVMTIRSLLDKDSERSSYRSQFTPKSLRIDKFGSDNEYPPIRVSDSMSISRVEGDKRYRRYDDEENFNLANSSYIDKYWSQKRTTNNSGSPRRPRSPPCKVGVSMWGHNTPILQKGFPMKIDRDHWCCPICYYTENPSSIDKCELCDCPNMSKTSDHGIKEQCGNCTFLNGHFATECEMCSKPMSSNVNS